MLFNSVLTRLMLIYIIHDLIILVMINYEYVHKIKQILDLYKTLGITEYKNLILKILFLHN